MQSKAAAEEEWVEEWVEDWVAPTLGLINEFLVLERWFSPEVIVAIPSTHETWRGSMQS